MIFPFYVIYKGIFIVKMKRKRGYNKADLLVDTTMLNIEYNRVFELEQNVLLFEFARSRTEPEIEYINIIVQEAIKSKNLVSLEIIKELTYKLMD